MFDLEHIKRSALFTRLTDTKELQHPTALDFNKENWETVFNGIESPTSYDQSLFRAAVFLSSEIKAVRREIGKSINQNYASSSVEGACAFANHQFLLLQKKSTKTNQRTARGSSIVHLENVGQKLIKTGTNQMMTADDLNTNLVDSLPHWIFHARKFKLGKGSLKGGLGVAQRCLILTSIERGLRDLWHSVLWEGFNFISIGQFHEISPHDPLLSEQWLVWFLRDYANMSFEAMTDASAVLMTKNQLPPVLPVLRKTVTAVRERKNRKAAIEIGRANGKSDRQRSHKSEHDMLDRLYTGIYLDEAFTRAGLTFLTCRILAKAWWILADLTHILVAKASVKKLETAGSLDACSMKIERSDLLDIFSRSLEIDRFKVELIVQLFTCDITDTRELFGSGLWHRPLIASDNGILLILASPILVSSPVKRVEYWLELGGISNRKRNINRGKKYEEHVRQKLSDALKQNSILKDFFVLPHGLKRVGQSEEIDLLLRIGSTIIVGEIKCLLSPSESLERNNYLDNLQEAIQQAKQKFEWVKTHSSEVAHSLRWSAPGMVSIAQIIPLVVTNTGFGLGLTGDEVSVVDLHFLKLVLSGGQYQSDTVVSFGQQFSRMITLYDSEKSFVEKAQMIFQAPQPLKRYKDSIQWHSEPFVTSGSKPLYFVVPRLNGMPINP